MTNRLKRVQEIPPSPSVDETFLTQLWKSRVKDFMQMSKRNTKFINYSLAAFARTTKTCEKFSACDA